MEGEIQSWEKGIEGWDMEREEKKKLGQGEREGMGEGKPRVGEKI